MLDVNLFQFLIGDRVLLDKRFFSLLHTASIPAVATLAAAWPPKAASSDRT